jgi:chromosome segregation ATPase
MDVKMTQLETSLKSKTKQLHQRIDQIKELSDLVNKLKEEKEQAEYKNEQCENVIKCQKMEIDSKASLVKQLELVSFIFLYEFISRSSLFN